MKFARKAISLTIIMATLCSFGMSSTNAATVSKNGFSYDTGTYYCNWTPASSGAPTKKQATRSIAVYSEKGGHLGDLIYTVGLLQSKEDKSDYVLMTRIVMDPNNETSVPLLDDPNSGNRTQYGYGYSEFASVAYTYLGTMGAYSPVNTPKTDVVNIGLSGSNSGVGVSASFEVAHNPLTVTNRSSTSKNRFQADYDYSPTDGVWASIFNKNANTYLAEESAQLSLVEFQKASTTKNGSKMTYVVALFKAEFGQTNSTKAAPGHIWSGKTRSKTYSIQLNFDVK